MAFQNPAQNFAEQRLSLGDLVTLSPHSTFLVRSDSNYPEAGIMQGSIFAIDRALTPQHRHMELRGDETIILLDENQDLPIWGVVAYALTDIAGLGFTRSFSD
ncbi:MAG: peptidase [Serratia marcescens]|uniref:Peptidase n=1 Tax=Pantoea eucrina TaxID=472693 RepID=A0ABS1ZAM5_9GAMM|nr:MULTISPECIES: hypothetical protein [Erwiniaceae]AIX76643.1 repressor [Pantoea sp. PSNIH2]MDU3787945.1 peptidase [Serratia marcescens]MDU3818628.1 peptidase [Pantoea sp.]POU40285.1 peptidase [Pantoea sp. PSNIH5]POU58439.1 peptidase [Pantoea sp. PSNIH4]POY65418.1 peptidase [Pantoea sp. PSNIH3]HBM9481104.1 peptidase [Klebsiella oxytoca]